MKKTEETVTLEHLNWDTDYFGVVCAKAILHKPLTLNEWKDLNIQFKKFHFISIVNKNSESANAQLIGNNTSAFLADVNIQFAKKIGGSCEIPKNITIHQSLEKNEQILSMADFEFSKFKDDPQLLVRGGAHIYQKWLSNSFGKQDKYFAIHKNDKTINGFALFSYSGSDCIIELISVSQRERSSGIGSSLFKAVEYSAFQSGCNIIKVGTQARNIGAINFYNKVDCREVEVHQVYHLWNDY